MTIITYRTHAVRCDARHCDEEYEGWAGQSRDDVCEYAREAGWLIAAIHRCPEHRIDLGSDP